MVRAGVVGAALLAVGLPTATPARITPAAIIDCPLRDARFSVDIPVIDIVASAAAQASVARIAPDLLTRLPAGLMRPSAPNFSALISLRSLDRLGPADAARLATLDQALRRLPVSAADRSRRCARYDATPSDITLPAGKPVLLIFERMTGYRDGPAVEAARRAILAIAAGNGWHAVVTDRAGAINPLILRQVSAVVWNNVSGDVLTRSQRKALRRFVEAGGGFVATHGAAGDIDYFWDWYRDTLIGARFIGHPLQPQFQDARVLRDDQAGAIGAGLPPSWTMRDEWYSFAASPRLSGARIVARLDESSYVPVGRQGDIRMGADHPIAWARCVGRGRSFYSAIGHLPETYAQPENVRILSQALVWAMGDGSRTCAR
jgi:type 1 glutamine amidotransferase